MSTSTLVAGSRRTKVVLLSGALVVGLTLPAAAVETPTPEPTVSVEATPTPTVEPTTESVVTESVVTLEVTPDPTADALTSPTVDPAPEVPTTAPEAVFDPALAPRAAKAWPVLRYGAKGSAVSYVQLRLGVPVTGTLNAATRDAVKALEQQNRLLVNGIVGPSVWRVLKVPYVKPAVASVSKSKLKPGTAAFGRAVLAEARKHKGKPYRYGATGPGSFDCSGFVGYTIKKATGKSLPRTSSAMRSATKRISKSDLRAGDLVFVHRGGRVSHVAIYDGKGRWWEASRPGTPLNLNKPWTSSVSYGRVR